MNRTNPAATLDGRPKQRAARLNAEQATAKGNRQERDHASGTVLEQRVADVPAEDWRISWPILTWLVVIHAGVLLAPWTFTWQACILAIGLHWLTGGIGICLGFHRLFTHSSFRTYAWVRWTLALLGGLAGEGSAVDWVSDHRKHHALSDQAGDPHSPHDGGWWSHIVWIVWKRTSHDSAKYVSRWAPDLAKDTAVTCLTNWFLPSQFIFGFLLGGIGWAIGGWPMLASFMVWGMFVRLAFVMHSTWFVNSASHMWGYRNYKTTDDSRNNWWVALITYGEGWHNNHHAYPRMAAHGHRWWEFDATFCAIRCLQTLGLAWDVVDYKKRSALGADNAAVE